MEFYLMEKSPRAFYPVICVFRLLLKKLNLHAEDTFQKFHSLFFLSYLANHTQPV